MRDESSEYKRKMKEEKEKKVEPKVLKLVSAFALALGYAKCKL